MSGNGLIQLVPTGKLSLDRLRPALRGRRFDSLAARLTTARATIDGRAVWHVNSTATGGGVAEMLGPITAYMKGLGLDARWAVVKGTPPFFDVTKRIHNGIHGVPPRLGAGDREVYEDVTGRNGRALRKRVRAGDVVLLHDPQTAGMIPELERSGAHVVWRSHIGNDASGSGAVAETWKFLAPYVSRAHAVVFSRGMYVPRELEELTHVVIHPSIDPLTLKNRRLSRARVRAILRAAGVLSGSPGTEEPVYLRATSEAARIRRPVGALREGEPPRVGTPAIVQISRWDRLKDPLGVMEGFARYVEHPGAHLFLAGPDVSGVTDDPEGNLVLEEVKGAWRNLPHSVRKRVHVIVLPMDDTEENAVLVNALQRYAKVVVQKSIYEGFGLTVTEAMWKARPVVATAVGGIQDQISSGTHGILIEDPHDLSAFGEAVTNVLRDNSASRRLARNARDRAASRFLMPRHLTQWLELAASLAQEGEQDQAA